MPDFDVFYKYFSDNASECDRVMAFSREAKQ